MKLRATLLSLLCRTCWPVFSGVSADAAFCCCSAMDFGKLFGLWLSCNVGRRGWLFATSLWSLLRSACPSFTLFFFFMFTFDFWKSLLQPETVSCRAPVLGRTTGAASRERGGAKFVSLTEPRR